MIYTAWTTNLCPNGSFETNLTGWTPLAGARLTRTSQGAVAGQYSMLVQTLGSYPGEGVLGPQAEVLDTVTGSVSLSVRGETGRLTVSAAVNPDGVILAQQAVTLDGTWQRITLPGLAVTATQSLYVIIQTPSPQALSYLVDGVQYEPESPAHPYIDGSFSGCDWLGGTPFGSASEQQAQFGFSLLGGFRVEGFLHVTEPGEVFQADIPAGDVNFGGSISTVVISPAAAFDDFALFEAGDPDPAMAYCGWNTAGLQSGKTAYTRPWGIFYPPVDYPASDGSLMWKRAQFMAFGLEFTGVAAGAGQNMTAAQVEMMPLAGTTGLDIQPVPSAYDTPRSVHLIVKPQRLNYCPNPAFSVSLAGWEPAGTAETAQDGTVTYGPAGGYDGVIYSPGYSMRVTMHSPGDGVTLTVPELIAGDIYTASVYVLPGAGLADVRMQVASTSGGIPGAGAAAIQQAVPAWLRSQVTFTAPASTITLGITGIAAAGALPVTFWLALSLIEAGEIAGTYFDGANGNPDYMWEAAPGLSRSYYYPGYTAGQQVLSGILGSHVPMSISAAEAVYLTPPTQ